MGRLAPLLRCAAVLAAVLLTGTLAAPAHAADIDVVQRFYADSGDRCPYGVTEGLLEFVRVPFNANAVNVRGTLVDKPLPTDPAFPCVDDRRYSVATFTAFSGRRPVDSEAFRANNARVAFSFQLTSEGFALIDLLVVQVCRFALFAPLPPVPVYCGPAQEYRPTNAD